MENLFIIDKMKSLLKATDKALDELEREISSSNCDGKIIEKLNDVQNLIVVMIEQAEKADGNYAK